VRDGFEKREKGEMLSITGMSRCGKTTLAIAKVKKNKSKKLLVWDPAGQFANKLGCETVRNSMELWQIIKGNKGNGKYALTFMGDGGDKIKEFSKFCYIAFYWGIISPCDVVAEELGQVTNPAKASGYWFVLVSNGLKYGINIFALAQRTQEIDNTLLGNCSKNIQFKVADIDIDKAVKNFGIAPPVEFYKFIEKDNTKATDNLRYGKTLENGKLAYKK
jgi:hypothetical protein